jgi:hypothetical protein
VAGRYQPLADDVTIAGDVRPNLSSAVNQKTKEIGLGSNPISSAFGEGTALLLRSVATAAELPAFATANQRAAPGIRG